MGKNKIARFRENENFALLHQPDFMSLFNGDFELKGKWHENFFKNNNPIVLELGCGRGEYTVELAQMFPNKNFIGIDVKGARLWRGAKTATEEQMANVAFVRTKIEVVNSLFGSGEVSEIWITFPDPQPNKAKKRLCSTRFLNRYAQFMVEKGIVHLKTDSQMLHEYTKAILDKNKIMPLETTNDLYLGDSDNETLAIKTTYEKLFIDKGYSITYLKFNLPANANLEEPEDFTFDMNVPKAKR